MNQLPEQQDEVGLYTAMLLPHPDTPCPAVRKFEARIVLLSDGKLKLKYVMQGDLDHLSIPPPASPTRADRLWEHTCFEAFLSVVGKTIYHEFNFAPSGAWAAYAFKTYREGGEPLRTEDPRIDVLKLPNRFELSALLNLDSILQGEPRTMFRFGLSAVIETEDSHRSYWALRHPAGRPDFHHPSCFVLEVKG